MIKKLCEDLPVEFKYVIDRDIDKLVNDEDYLLDLELKLHSDFPLVYSRHFSLFLKHNRNFFFFLCKKNCL